MIVWKLDELMRQRRIKGRQLAKRMGIGENYLSRVRHEVPDRLSLSLLDALCRELGCTIADLLEYVPGEPHPAPAPARRAAPAPIEAPPAPLPVELPASLVALAVSEETIVVPVVEAPVAEAPAPPRPRPVLPLMAPLNAPQIAPTPAPVEHEPETAQRAAYLKGGALQAKLARLRQRRDELT